MNAQISKIFRQEHYFNIFIIFIVSKNLSYQSQIKSIILRLITQNRNFYFISRLVIKYALKYIIAFQKKFFYYCNLNANRQYLCYQ